MCHLPGVPGVSWPDLDAVRRYCGANFELNIEFNVKFTEQFNGRFNGSHEHQLATESPGSSHSHVGLLVFSLSCDFVFSCFVCSPCLCVRPFAARRFKQVLDTHDTPHDCHDASINVSRWRVIFVVLVVLLFILVFVFILQLASV